MDKIISFNLKDEKKIQFLELKYKLKIKQKYQEMKNKIQLLEIEAEWKIEKARQLIEKKLKKSKQNCIDFGNKRNSMIIASQIEQDKLDKTYESLKMSDEKKSNEHVEKTKIQVNTPAQCYEEKKSAGNVEKIDVVKSEIRSQLREETENDDNIIKFFERVNKMEIFKINEPKGTSVIVASQVEQDKLDKMYYRIKISGRKLNVKAVPAEVQVDKIITTSTPHQLNEIYCNLKKSNENVEEIKTKSVENVEENNEVEDEIESQLHKEKETENDEDIIKFFERVNKMERLKVNENKSTSVIVASQVEQDKLDKMYYNIKISEQKLNVKLGPAEIQVDKIITTTTPDQLDKIYCNLKKLNENVKKAKTKSVENVEEIDEVKIEIESQLRKETENDEDIIKFFERVNKLEILKVNENKRTSIIIASQIEQDKLDKMYYNIKISEQKLNVKAIPAEIQVDKIITTSTPDQLNENVEKAQMNKISSIYIPDQLHADAEAEAEAEELEEAVEEAELEADLADLEADLEEIDESLEADLEELESQFEPEPKSKPKFESDDNTIKFYRKM